MTVNELFTRCKKEIAKGNGDKEIMISNDDEGNGYHELYYGFTHDVKECDLWGEIDEPETKIILG